MTLLKQLAAARQELAMTQASLECRNVMLDSCEAALEQRDKLIKELRHENLRQSRKSYKEGRNDGLNWAYHFMASLSKLDRKLLQQEVRINV